MAREILVHIKAGEKRVVILNNGKIDDFFLEVDNQKTILGNIYKGRVESILPSINGAFVNIGQEKNGFLYLTDAVNPLFEEELSGPRKFFNNLFGAKKEENPESPAPAAPPPEKKHKEQPPPALKQGQEILVQVVKEPFANKGARLTTHVTLAGRFVVYMPYDKQLGISKKIEDQGERQRLRDVLNEFRFIRQGGFIIRTVSQQQKKDDLIRDAKFLVKIWHGIFRTGEKKTAPALVFKEFDLLWKVVRDFLRDDVTQFVIDSNEDYLKVCDFVQKLVGREMLPKIKYYKDVIPLFDARNITKELEKIYDTRVYLKSGASIVIEQTEGMTVVDVNSGKFKVKASPEDAAFMVNLEAAPEIARQLRLRDLGGIIVIDFIDMVKEGHKRRVIEALEEGLSHDYAKTEVNRISALGLVEMTRARAGKTIESISFQTCPYCDGRGRVKIK
ncbi:MAG: hypothetical protein A2Z88_03240 [Omnitrophica WOR_2 bacterium GWA2_47_8]|nr:MAG: hypothetical protein A2Z88_03240 [Omnitrophica WOR_2 bacterium GWA2_47_8]